MLNLRIWTHISHCLSALPNYVVVCVFVHFVCSVLHQISPWGWKCALICDQTFYLEILLECIKTYCITEMWTVLKTKTMTLNALLIWWQFNSWISHRFLTIKTTVHRESNLILPRLSDSLLRGQVFHGQKAGGVWRLWELPGPWLHEQGELRSRGERGLGVFRPSGFQGTAVHTGERRISRLPALERPQWSHGLLQANQNGEDENLLAYLCLHAVCYVYTSILYVLNDFSGSVILSLSAWRALQDGALWRSELHQSVCWTVWRLSLPPEHWIQQEQPQLH